MEGQKLNSATSNDEIDLIELVHFFWQQKRLITLITCIGAILGIIYILLSKPIYEVKAFISPPTLADIVSFNYGRSHADTALLHSFSIRSVYGVFEDNLLSESTRRSFFSHVYLPSLSEKERDNTSQEVLYKQFSSIVSVKELQKAPIQKYVLITKNTDPARAVLWAKQYVELVNKKTLNEMSQIITKENESIISDFKNRISMAREVAKAQRIDRLVVLKEAVSTAKAADIQTSLSANLTSVVALNEPSMMYLRGTKALNKEIENLSERLSDDPFTPQLRELEGNYNLYKKNSFSKNATVFRLDGVIYTPDLPISPKKWFILGLSIMLGLMLGLSTAFIKMLINARKLS